MPKPIPPNLTQYLQNELKQYAVLPSQDIVMDYCGIDSGEKTGSNRLLIAAAESSNIERLIKVCKRASISIEAIEPPMLAYARAFYDKKISRKSGRNVLWAVIENGFLTLYVFRNRNVDFVRNKKTSEMVYQTQELCSMLAKELNKIIQFYDIDVPDSCGKWEIVIINNSAAKLSEDAPKLLKKQIANTHLEIITSQNALKATVVKHTDHCDKPSPVAIGLAMKLLGNDKTNLTINLLPSKINKFKAVKNDALITANVGAILLFLMILTLGILVMITNKANKDVTRKKNIQFLNNTHKILEKHDLIDAKFNELSDKLGQINKVLNSHQNMDWAGFLNDIRKSIPKKVRITNLSSNTASSLTLKGYALSQKAVNLYVNVLNDSECIESVYLTEVEKDNSDESLVSYAIDCSIIPGKVK
jgi:Tfp pilus assembly protein PilN